MKVFVEGENDAWVLISGTLTGPEVGYPNNTYTISCVKEEHECSISHIDQIGTNQIGRLEVAYNIPIAQWNGSEVIASQDDTNPFCQKTTVTLDRKLKTASWLDVPINTASAFCKNADKQARKYTIEDAPGWKRLSGK